MFQRIRNNLSFIYCLLLALLVSVTAVHGEAVVERSAQQIVNARDFEFDGVTFESTYAEVKAAFPDAKNAPLSSRPVDTVELLAPVEPNVKLYVRFSDKVKHIRSFKILIGAPNVKKAGGVEAAYANIEKQFGKPSSAEVNKMNGEKLAAYIWRYRPEVEREIHLSVRDKVGEELLILTVANTSVKDSPAP